MNIGLVVLTHVPSGNSNVRRRLPECLESLDDSGHDCDVRIVDDGSTDSAHLEFLKSCDGVIHRENGGIWRAKNTCIRVLSEMGCEFGFIAEDDIVFQPGWMQRYVEAWQQTGIHHFSWGWDANRVMQKSTVRLPGGFAVDSCSVLNGCLLTVTPEVIKRVGGFRPLPYHWGYTHTNWSRRCVLAGLTPFFADVTNSNHFVRMGTNGMHSAVPDSLKTKARQGNKRTALNITRIHWPVEE